MKGKACAAGQQKRRLRSRMGQWVEAARSEAGEVGAAHAVAVRQYVHKVGEGRVVVRKSEARRVEVACMRRLVEAAHSFLVEAAAALCCHFACDQHCGFDCATECADYDCDCGWRWDFYSCSDSDCDCGYYCDCCGHNARLPSHPCRDSQRQPVDSRQPLHHHWVCGRDDGGQRTEPHGSRVEAGKEEAVHGTA